MNTEKLRYDIPVAEIWAVEAKSPFMNVSQAERRHYGPAQEDTWS